LGNNSIRERLLLYTKIQRDTIEELKYGLLLKAFTMDRTDAGSVSDFNMLSQQLNDLRTGTVRKKKTAADANKIIQDFKVNFPKKQKKAKIKNFERAQ
jgi:hypothetical protein